MRDLALKTNSETCKIGEILTRIGILNEAYRIISLINLLIRIIQKLNLWGIWRENCSWRRRISYAYYSKENRQKIINSLPELVFTPIKYEPEGTRILSVVS